MPTTATKPRKKSAAKKSTSSTRSRPSSRLATRKAAGLPDWKDLDTGKRSKKGTGLKAKGSSKKGRGKTSARRRPLDAVPSLKTGLLVLFAFVAVVAFVNHVYGTRATLDELQDARRENERLRLTHQRLQGDVDRMTGPEAVMPRAAALGLEESVAYGPTVVLEDS